MSFDPAYCSRDPRDSETADFSAGRFAASSLPLEMEIAYTVSSSYPAPSTFTQPLPRWERW